MVFEQFLTEDKIKKHSIYILLLGMFYVFFGYFVGDYFFAETVSVAMLFTCTLLLVPSVNVILGIEEKIESKDGIKHFFSNHKDIFKMYLFLFLGIFFAYMVLGQIYGSANVFEYQTNFLTGREDLSADLFSKEIISGNLPNLAALVSHNLMVVVICFLLSLFYGAGALFLITLNASVFAVFITHVAGQVKNAFSIIGLFMIHLIPELSGFLVAAIAGGVVSKALMKEKIGSKGFRNVMQDAIILLLISFALILLGAVLELFVTARLVSSFI